MTYIPNTDANRKSMMSTLGIKSVEDLLTIIPDDVRIARPLNLHPSLSEL